LEKALPRYVGKTIETTDRTDNTDEEMIQEELSDKTAYFLTANAHE